MIVAALAHNALARPELSGPEQIAREGRFVVHYTEQGTDRVDPAAVPRVLDALVAAEQAYLADGWREIPPDDGEGGDDGIDVYLNEVDINGYAHPVGIGEAPAMSCWMEIDSDLDQTGGLVLESVAAHELHHCVQYAYTSDGDLWLYEATATWAQYRLVVDDVLELGVAVLWSNRLSHPERAIDDTGDRFEYAAFLFVKYWTEAGGTDVARAPALWEAFAEADADWDDAFESEARRVWDRSFDDVFLDHAVWNGFACARDDGAHYDPLVHRCLIDASVPVDPVTDGFVATHLTDPGTTAYFELAADGDSRPIQVDCGDPGEDARAGVALVARDAAGAAGETATAWASEEESFAVRLDGALDPDGSVLIVHASTGRDPAVQECAITRVDAIVPEGCGCGTADPRAAIAVIAAFLSIRRRPPYTGLRPRL